MTKDDFRKHQKALCPPRRGGPGKRGIYGCSCCRRSNLSVFKQETRRQARRLFQLDTNHLIEEQLNEMGYWQSFYEELDYRFWEAEEEEHYYGSLEDRTLEEIEVFFYEEGGHSTYRRRPLKFHLPLHEALR